MAITITMRHAQEIYLITMEQFFMHGTWSILLWQCTLVVVVVACGRIIQLNHGIKI